jgi:hypothetical protein
MKTSQLTLLTVFLFLFTGSLISVAQTCTIDGAGTINWSVATCQEGGVSPTDNVQIIVPVGVNLNIDADPNHTGSLFIHGTVTNNHANSLWNGNIYIETGGQLILEDKLDIGSGAGCGFSVYIFGEMHLNGSGGSDLLAICGNKIAQSGGGCEDCGGTNDANCPYDGSTPYCEPDGPPTGFYGPLGYGENGFNAALPVRVENLRGRQLNNVVKIDWVTTMEDNFSKFVIERSTDGASYVQVGELKGQGRNLQGITSSYGFIDRAPFLGKNYYRLRQIDLDNTEQLSSVFAVDYIGAKSFTIYPNPLNGKALSYESNFHPSEHDRIIISNQLGVEILNIEALDPRRSFEFKDMLEAGVYFVRYTGREFQTTVRLVVAK